MRPLLPPGAPSFPPVPGREPEPHRPAPLPPWSGLGVVMSETCPGAPAPQPAFQPSATQGGPRSLSSPALSAAACHLLITILILITGTCPRAQTQQPHRLLYSSVGRQGIFLELLGRTVRVAWGGRVDAFWSFLRGGRGACSPFRMSTLSLLCPPSSYYHPYQRAHS